MAAPQGNQFWQLRSKHGRDKLFASPELMWEAACEYFQWCVENPLMEIDFKGKDADRVELPRMRAFTMEGVCRYMHCNTAYFRVFKSAERKDSDGFDTVIKDIEDTVREQKFTGAAAGFLNANLISRDLGLADKQDIKHDGIPAPQTVVFREAPPKEVDE